MREPRWGTPRPTAAAAAVSLILLVILAAIAPSPWSGGWRPTEAGTSLWVPEADGAHQSTAPKLLAGGAEHLPTPGQLRSTLAVGFVAAAVVLLSPAWAATGPTAVPRRDAQRIVATRGPPRS
ncbi:hypothetical protein [Streptosporangium sp. NBC_01756]|uniref:hypothetical protein n=1 Tax=Streptosporangium sp. NBC_01756 TaxID=2975950 RepID=UPI002DD7FDF2|nr:hypothetical protein [Streptosporangium sp. NBC_01756]WSC88997.1 hypothetical protein OIE48_12640 [Streptosporangium sp. NBC_01756]